MKQWELPNNTVVELPDGTLATFLKMDGMYAHWDIGGELQIGNYDNIERVDGVFKVVPKKTQKPL